MIAFFTLIINIKIIEIFLTIFFNYPNHFNYHHLGKYTVVVFIVNFILPYVFLFLWLLLSSSKYSISMILFWKILCGKSRKALNMSMFINIGNLQRKHRPRLPWFGWKNFLRIHRIQASRILCHGINKMFHIKMCIRGSTHKSSDLHRNKRGRPTAIVLQRYLELNLLSVLSFVLLWFASINNMSIL